MTRSKSFGLQADDLDRLLRDGDRALDERQRDAIELLARDRQRHRDRRAALGVADAGDLLVDRELARELLLDLLGDEAEARERDGVGARVVVEALEDLERHALGEQAVDVVAAERRVAGGREHLEDVAGEVEQRDVERAAAEVVDGDLLRLRDRLAVRERRGGRLVEDAEHLEAGELAGDLRRRALEVVEVRGDGDDGALDRPAERVLGDGLRAAQDERADLGQRVGDVAREHHRAVLRALDELEREAAARRLHLVASRTTGR